MGIFNRKPRTTTSSPTADAVGELTQVPAKITLPPPAVIVRQFIEDGKWGADTVRRAGRQLPPTFRWVCLRCKSNFNESGQQNCHGGHSKRDHTYAQTVKATHTRFRCRSNTHGSAGYLKGLFWEFFFSFAGIAICGLVMRRAIKRDDATKS